MGAFLGIDHLDVRVPSIDAVETFYDGLFPELGLARKVFAVIGADETWTYVGPGEPRDVVEYFAEPEPGRPAHFIGLIEDPRTVPVATRIAFRVATGAEVKRWVERLPSLGACNVEVDDDFASYPAVFFEDPVGTRLEICARLAR